MPLNPPSITNTNNTGEEDGPVSAGANASTTAAAGGAAVAGLFKEPADAEAALHALKAAGFMPDQVGLAMHDPTGLRGLVRDSGGEAAAGAASGAIGGGLLGGLGGFLVGLGALTIPGVGPVLAGGFLATAFGLAGGTAIAGAGLGAAVGGVAGALAGIGLSEPEVLYFEREFRGGGALVAVSTGPARAAEARRILERHGADIGPASSRGSAPVGHRADPAHTVDAAPPGSTRASGT